MKNIFKIFVVFILIIGGVLPGMTATRTTVARAGTRQNVINTGTKVEAAKTISESSCQEKYDACMDMGCIVDNESGGRCQCSNQIKNLNAQFKQIKQDFLQSEKMENVSVEKINLGTHANQILSRTPFDDDEEDDEEENDFELTGEIGDKLRAQMHEICAKKIPECKSQLTLVKNMYSQKVKSDCAAYENALKNQGRVGRDKRMAAEKSVRDAALTQLQESNKYDLGTCTIEFSKCMQTKAECGDDFTGCVSTVGKENIYGGVKNTVAISGENSSVVIAKSTMEVLESKKIICESVLNSCVKVKDDVWNTFLRTNAQQIKIAESKSESNIRTSCLDNVSDCFVNACKDTIDGNTSYDACLSRPEMVKSFCRVELEPCLAATGGTYDNPESSTLWPGILAKLSAMRVDSCTKEIKDCMQSKDRCGPDYSQCIGLDTNIIMRMCPYDKLPGCQKVYGKEKVQGDDIYDDVAQIIEGTILNIDNEMLATCETAVDTAMSKVCGDTESCAAYALGTKIGAQSLEYKVCQYSTDSPDSTKGFKWFDCRPDIESISDYELGRNKNATSEELGPVLPFAGVITGVIKWESVEITDDGMIDVESYVASLDNEKDIDITERDKELVRDELNQLQNDINRVIKQVEGDNFVQFCMTGRHVQGVTDMFKNNKVRFPQLSNTIRKNIATAALQQAKDNYYRKYDKLAEQMQTDMAKIQTRLATNLKLNGEDAKRIAAREACVGMAAISAFSKAPVGQSLWAKIMVGIIVVAAIVVATVFTAGSFLGVSLSVASALYWSGVALAIGGAIGAAAIVADAAITGVANAQNAAFISAQEEKQNETHGEFFANEWNYQEKITTDFDDKTMVCKKCVSMRHCKKTKWSLFSDRICKKWETDDFVDERCIEIQF